MMSQLPCFRCLFVSCQQQKNTKNGAAVTSLRSFLFPDDFNKVKNVCEFFGDDGGFQLLDLIIRELKSHMTCYNSMPLIG